jgi:DNA-binding response OmpR family regulator
MDALMTFDLPAAELGSVRFNQQQLLGRSGVTHYRTSLPADATANPRVLRVLVVDDDQDTTNALGWLVNYWGHATFRAYEGAAAVRLAGEQRPDVVLLDIEMPHMDGLEAARQLRLNSSRDNCFIIAVTGWGDAEHHRQCLEAGVDLVLIKPVEPSVLETLLALESGRVQPAQPAAPQSSQQVIWPLRTDNLV